MRDRIPITSSRAVQLVAVATAAFLLANAYFIGTQGRDFPPFRCAPPWEPPVSSLLAGLRGGVGVGLLVAALHAPVRGLRLRDPLFIGMLLVLGASFALSSGLRALVTGIIYLGRRGCIELGPPFSYPLGALSTVVGVALVVGAALVLFQGSRDGDD